jgi:hydroxyethylthiazole kinase
VTHAIAESAAAGLRKLRLLCPLVHNVTNYVVMDVSANALLAIGASPVMAHAVEEVEEMVGLAGALVINIGTLSPAWVDAMLAAGRAAKARGIPVVLDPVGAGATHYRTETALRILEQVQPTIVRGNASEVLALARAGGGTRGVDSSRCVDEARAAALALARHSRAVVAVTGPEDLVSDGSREVRVANGHALMSRVTGTGCVASALTGGLAAVEPDALVAAAAALVVFGVVGELAAVGDPRPGSFRTRMIDALDAVTPEIVLARARVTSA